MIGRKLKLLLLFFLALFGHISAIDYKFYNDPIDVVIPAVDKDLETLELCIKGIRENCSRVRRVIVISSKKLTESAEWFDESRFPFNKKSVALHLCKYNQELSKTILKQPQSRVGWYYQQLLKLYAAFVIPNISSNVLILDSDTIFLKPVEFLNASYGGLYNPGAEHHIPYFEHMDRFLPGLIKLFPDYSGISHHMIFQRPVLKDLFRCVETHHQKPLWMAFCECVDTQHLVPCASGASEYEIYFNFVFSRTSQVEIRPLKWVNSHSFKMDHDSSFDYVSCHSHMR